MKKHNTFKSANGENMIHVVSWIPDGEVRAVVQISHGMVEYIERYDDFAAYLNRFGILVVGNDHLGHGKSVDNDDGFGYFAKKNASRILVEDLHTVTRNIKKRYPRVPYFLVGHSMGSFLARRYLMTYGDELTGAVIMGTGSQPPAVLEFGKIIVYTLTWIYGEHHRSALADNIMFGLYNRKIADKRTSKDWLTRDNSIVDKYIGDKYCSFIFTLNGLNGLLNTISYIQRPENVEKIPKELPLFFVAGLEDPVGNYGEGVLKVYDSYKEAGIEAVSIKLYEGCRHELVNELNKYEVYKDIKDWIVSKM